MVYLELTKARIVVMVLIATAAGFLAAADDISLLRLIETLVGTAFVAAGTNALNQYAEREHDGQMRRTRNRPLPSGRMTPRAALLFSVAIAAAGTLYLAVRINVLSAGLAAFTLTSYIFVYTPLKRRSTLCTIVGAVPGAMPPLIGAAAVAGSLPLVAWILFAFLFFWQLPHFMAISWLYRDDYRSAGFVMSSGREDGGASVAQQSIVFSIALIACSVAPFLAGLAGRAYLALAIVAGISLMVLASRFFADRQRTSALRLFIATNLYLPVVLAGLVIAARQ